MKFMEIVEFRGGKFCLGRLESRVSGEDFIWVKWRKITHQWDLGSIVGAGGTLLFYSYIVCSCALLLHPFLDITVTFLIYIEVTVICVLELSTLFPSPPNSR